MSQNVKVSSFELFRFPPSSEGWGGAEDEEKISLTLCYLPRPPAVSLSAVLWLTVQGILS